MAASLAVWLLGAYLVLVLPVDERLWPAINRPYAAVFTILATLAGSCALVLWLHFRERQWLPEGHLKNLALVSFVALLQCLALDAGYTVYTNVRRGPVIPNHMGSEPQLQDAELHPRHYYPARENFQLLKPNATLSGYSYGHFYSPEMSQLPALIKSVLTLRHVDFEIDRFGFRETHAPEGAGIFALGDSFCFGQHVEQQAGWVEVLDRKLGKTVYNLSIAGSSPAQQLLLLKYVLARYPGVFRPKRLLWMVFEGNDLEDDYAPVHAAPSTAGLAAALNGTLLETIASVPRQVRRQSVIRFFTSRESNLIRRSGAVDKRDPYIVDGRELSHPLYYSTRYGYRLFEPAYLERARMDEQYVLGHPNRPKLDQAFKDMSALSRQKGFAVTVLIAPSDARMYANAFGVTPPVSREPFLIRYVERLAHATGFECVDLERLLKPYAERELLYQRDDSHWSERGNAVVAELVARHAFQQ